MKKLIFAGIVASIMVPTAGFAQGTPSGTMEPPSEPATSVPAAEDSSDTSTPAAPAAAPAGAPMAASPATAGNYTIVKKTAAELDASASDTSVNRNTDPESIQKTVDANPGLAEKLEAEGVEMDDIGAISVEPNGLVTVFSKS